MIQQRFSLFVLLVATAACGSDRRQSAVAKPQPPSIPRKSSTNDEVAEPLAEEGRVGATGYVLRSARPSRATRGRRLSVAACDHPCQTAITFKE